MQLVKPQQAGLVFRTFDNAGKSYLCVSVSLLVDLESGTPLPDVQMWQLAAEALDEEAIFDEGMFKPHAEMLVSGWAFPPAGAAVCQVRAQVGSVDKSVVAIGDREWLPAGPTQPEPFEKMPLTYRQAYGGDGFERNPIGKGIAPILDARGKRRHPLPNLERPGALITSPQQKPDPACFGPIDALWPQRRPKLGTYDGAYMRTHFPGFAADFDWSYYNVAPKDQQREGYWRGDESVVLENLHPERRRVEATLPSLWGRCVLRRAGGGFEDLPLQLDTVHLLPHAVAAALIFRGVTPVVEDDADDVEVLLAACERKGEPRPLSHYERVAELRADPARGAVHALRDADLLPEGMVPAMGEVGEMDELIATSGAIFDNQRRGMQHAFEDVHRRMDEAGFDKSELPAPEIPEREKPPERHELADYLDKLEAEVDKQRAEADAHHDAAKKKARAQLAALNVDYEQVMEDETRGHPPKLDAEARYQDVLAQLELMRNAGVPAGELEAQIEDGSLRSLLLRLQWELSATYRRFAHHFPEAARLEGDASTRIREEVERALRDGESLAGRDLTGADLGGLDLTGADMTGTFLASANLTRCNLSRANLTDAVLARADLTHANLAGAEIVRTNFGEAKLDEADFGSGAELRGAILTKASLCGAKLPRALLSSVDLMDAKLRGCDLTGLRAEASMFMGVDLSRARLDGCALVRCTFLYVDARGVEARGADLSRSVFMDCVLDEAKLDGATCSNLCVVGKTSLANSSLVGARADHATFEKVDMTGVDLTDAVLTGAVLSGSDLTQATLHRVAAVGALFIRTCLYRATLTDSNLRDALLGNADLRACDLSGSLLFRADLSRVRTSGDTKVKQADIRYCTYIERREEGP